MTYIHFTCTLFFLLSSLSLSVFFYSFFFFNDTATTEIYTLSLHDALPIFAFTAVVSLSGASLSRGIAMALVGYLLSRSEEHTSELQSRFDLVCRLLLEKKKKKKI